MKEDHKCCSRKGEKKIVLAYTVIEQGQHQGKLFTLMIQSKYMKTLHLEKKILLGKGRKTY